MGWPTRLVTIVCLLTFTTLDASENNVFGRDDRVPASVLEYPLTSVVLVQHAFGTCTGSLVGLDLVLTNAHCLRSVVLENRIVHSLTVLGKNKEGQSLHARVIDGLWGRIQRPVRRKQDWAVLKIDRALGRKLGYFKIRPVDLTGTSVSLAGYPNPELISEVPLLLQKSCRVHRMANSIAYHDCDATSGNSGSPLFVCQNKNQCDIVAIHSASRTKIPGELLHLPEYSPRYSNLAVLPQQWAWAIEALDFPTKW